jgi:hypothetical protein
MQNYTLIRYHKDIVGHEGYDFMEKVMSSNEEHILIELMESLSDEYPNAVMWIADNFQEMLAG